MKGDQALRRLTYIAVKVAQKKDPLLAHLRHIESHDKMKLDDLIRIKKDFFYSVIFLDYFKIFICFKILNF
ncbi:hypothetical protein T01_4019 [Trichinella spiralis]|uniref:Uncharacterized protein n=1 Tax=Trichinella spiralis TaxID=6334 RepID=A0A0V1B504_TRISP|nr:hypothetical protein T01_2286 [Trichinella spiralis]KRY32081.1 hypothetical protein T01_4019 [Trichinella spiralis]